MEKIYESNLIYTTEHITCPQYNKSGGTGFRYREYPEGCVIARDSTIAHTMMFILEGDMEASIMPYDVKRVRSGEMFLIPANSFISLKCLKPTIAVAMVFNHWEFSCIQTPFEELKQYNKNKPHDVYIERINEQLMQYLDLMKMYLRNGANCCYLHKIKTDEFFFLMRAFYSKEKLSSLFFLMLDETMDFRMFCFKNVNNVKSIKELIALSHMSRNVFYAKFHAEFGGVSPKDWLNEYVNQRIIHIAATPGMTVKNLMYKAGFEDESSFAQYCRRHFNKVPTELIKGLSMVRDSI